MKLYANPTSPFVRIVRMVLIEKGLNESVDTAFVDAWADDPAFLDANPAGRVPTLVTDDGARLTEALLILTHLDAVGPKPAVLAGGPAALSAAGVAIGVFDAAVAVIIGRKSAPDFDTGLVGKKRFRTMQEGLRRLDAVFTDSQDFGLPAIAAITALDYLAFRFPNHDWGSLCPKVAAFRDAQGDRPSVRDTVPRG
ncbi:glutathione S-transferase family protein [Methylobacterium frigidaeris]|uniref:GST-like protein YibF n=1 Tax=Methylobacterium frigidaeris TaxID=2038277 RepID=A0AA37HBF2_9HYPH|nr:glutathione S-transferase family protein [Methylobacterium frigidaeris]PIK70222.1 glutathione S-transferase [Methylobacterium frigidaeris]GJD62145.1 putative GST-like protein YibF [Methylobacterium frigidaeris]